MKLLPSNLTKIEIANDVGGTTNHVLEPDMINAVNAALVINRPLLIWGEPGIGKSQLAKAAAKELGRPFLHFVADARTEAHDLLWHFDAVSRLAEAQLRQEPGSTKDASKGSNPLAKANFVSPGPLWCALNWESAKKSAHRCKKKLPDLQGRDAKNGFVVLIDEIDKASSDVPNGLLEALGANRFQPQDLDEPVICSGTTPLVFITTNEERALPDAFQRRCLSLHLAFPKEIKDQNKFLINRAKENALHFLGLTDDDFQLAAQLLVEDRQYADSKHLYPLPGQAEYFDMLRGIQRLHEQSGKPAKEYINQLRSFVYQKLPDFHANTS